MPRVAAGQVGELLVEQHLSPELPFVGGHLLVDRGAGRALAVHVLGSALPCECLHLVARRLYIGDSGQCLTVLRHDSYKVVVYVIRERGVRLLQESHISEVSCCVSRRVAAHVRIADLIVCFG